LAKRRNTLNLETKGFEELVTKLEGLNGDVKKVVTDALEQAAETIEEDTREAMSAKYLPAKGIYSQGDTKESIVEPDVSWSGTKAEVGVGFDYSEKGAGGFLISGTPRMQPDTALEKIYVRKKYMKQIQQDMMDVVQDAIDRKLGGR